VQKLTPPKVVINEAVELAKEFGAETSPKFVNGVLGSVIADIQKQRNQ
jgi:transcription antitermination protein NusB